MADTKISGLTALTGANTASGDLLTIVDVSDTTMAATGTNKKITLTELQGAPVSAGTANGVLYLNASKVATSGSALTYNGTNFSNTLSSNASAGIRVTNSNTGTSTSANTAYSNGAETHEFGILGTSYAGYGVLAAGEAYIYAASSKNISFASDGGAIKFGVGTGASEAMRLTSTGLGIGTSSPGAKLEVNAGANTDIRINTSASGYLQLGQFTNGAFIGTSSSSSTNGNLRLGTGGTTQATLDSSGNLGLGVTPSAWGSGFKAFEVGKVGSGLFSVGNTSLQITNNYYYNGTNYIYANNGAAARYHLVDGTHLWFNAASGTAGGAITFTQAMTLDASGFLFLGCTTTPSASVKGIRLTPDFTTNTPKFSTGSATGLVYMIEWINGNGIVGSISTNGSATAYNTSSDYRLKNIDGPLTGSGAFIDALKPKVGTWKADGSKFVGFLAHEVQEVSPASVTGEKDGEEMQAMEYGSAEFIANIVAELQSLRKRLADAGIA